MKRVLLLIKGLGRGGAEQLLVSAAPYLDQTRWEYEVAYLLPWKDALVPDFRKSGLPVHCLGRTLGWVARLRALVRERNIAVIHAHSPVPGIGARVALGRRGGPRLVYTEHNVWERYHRATYWGNLLTFPRNDHVFAVADHVRVSIRYPPPLRRRRMPPIETLYGGLDPALIPDSDLGSEVLDELGIPRGVPIVGTVANFKPSKGHLHLIEAAARVRQSVPDVRFVLVGQGPLEDEVRRRATELGLDGTVLFAGYREDATRVAGAFDVFALSSVYEGLPIALLEAMALGRPPVVTAVGGLPEVVTDGVNGLVVPPAHPQALAHGITTILRDRELRERLGVAAARRARDFDIRTAVRRTEQVYEELLA